MASGDDIELDYAYLMQNALRDIVKQVLTITRDLGDVPGEHHFFIEFMTTAPGVQISETLLKSYPERMTIVLQHKFEDLTVEEDHFGVTLHFQGVPNHLVIPWDALLSFADPSADFGLRFEPERIAPEDITSEENTSLTENTEESSEDTQKVTSLSDQKEEHVSSEQPAPNSEETAPSDKTSADVVSLDSFRKK
ncbi:MAG: SspB family protein [bacterium]